ncbi:MAG: class I SAM-dependent methyltransferase [Candidatus Bathyarchaeota archaeon]|nr:class I SAM-dependent methyltransferase [Candidatus Bathyarchaeota archaeon]
MEQVQKYESACICEPDECDTFKFMAKRLGMKVLHPGGLDATEILAEQCGILEDMIILDAGCGSGSTSTFLAKRFGCKVIGVDVDHGLLMKANSLAHKEDLTHKTAFRYADIQNLPFQDGTFDGSIIQATLIFTNKSKALQMITKKVRKNGFIGVIELAWKSNPTEEIVQKVRDVLCKASAHTECHDGWINLLNQADLEVVNTELRDLDFNFRSMLRNEGIFSTSRIALKSIYDESIREKTNQVTNLFKETKKYLGYGIYICRKR